MWIIMISWDMTPYCLSECYKCSERTCCLVVQSRIVSYPKDGENMFLQNQATCHHIPRTSNRNLDVCIFLEKFRKISKVSCQDSWSCSWDMNQTLFKCKEMMLSTQSQHSVIVVLVVLCSSQVCWAACCHGVDSWWPQDFLMHYTSFSSQYFSTQLARIVLLTLIICFCW
jgi:hypothetical protein